MSEPEIIDIREKDGFKYYAFEGSKDGSGDSSYFTFVDEEEVRTAFYYPFLIPEMHVLDIGAGYGSYTLPALQKGCDVTVITPQVRSSNEHVKLKMNIALNNYEKKCRIIDRALYSEYGWINPNTKHFAKYSHLKVQDEKSDINDYVRCAPIDDLIPQDQKIDFIKMDVEGAEYEAIKGAKRTIHLNKPTMLIENHLFHDANIDKRIVHLVLSWDLGYMAAIQPYAQISHTLFTIRQDSS